jgi:flagellar biosynthesis/type III secretory pathway chaperone
MEAVLELEKILHSEMDVYKELYRLEEEKSRTIIERDGKNLKNITDKEEALIAELSLHESKRTQAVKLCCVECGLDAASSPSISELAAGLNLVLSARVTSAGASLKQAVLKVKNTQEINDRLIKDNMDFFKSILSGLKDSTSISAGYDSDGRENNKVTGALLFNKIA